MGFNRYALVLTLLVGGAVSATTGCSNSGGGGARFASVAAPISSASPGSVTTAAVSSKAGSTIVQANWEDKDGDGRASKGDVIKVAFAEEVKFNATSLDASKEFSLAVTGDSFGTGATVGVDPQNVTGAQIVLGDSAKLKIGGAYVSTAVNAGAPSGINVSQFASGMIVSAREGVPVAPGVDAVDIAGVSSAAFRDGASMVIARGGHEATLLDDGRVLITGGMRDGKKGTFAEDAEIYDPATGQFVTVASLSGNTKGRMLNKDGKLTVVRINHTATKLQDGRVLILGGYGTDRKGFFGLGSAKVEVIAAAHVFDPKTNTFSYLGDMNYDRHSHTATLLTDGRVMIAGGYSDSFWSRKKTNAPFEIFDPKTNKFTEETKWIILAKTTVEKRMNHAAVLTDRGVLLAGGEHWEGGFLHFFGTNTLKLDSGSEVYEKNDWKKLGALKFARRNGAAATLSTKEVLLAGGHNDKTTVGQLETFSSATGQWTAGPTLAEARTNAKLAIDGDQAFVIGGFRMGVQGAAETKKVEIYNAATKAFDNAIELKTGRVGCSVVKLQDGRIFVTGGFSGAQKDVAGKDGQALASTELYGAP